MRSLGWNALNSILALVMGCSLAVSFLNAPSAFAVEQKAMALKKASKKKSSSHASAKAGNGSKTKMKPSLAKEYSTNHSFEGSAINGKVQEGNMRRIVVEDDKSLADLLGVRKNFKDRETQERERNASW